MPIKQVYILPLSAVGLVLLASVGLAQNTWPQSIFTPRGYPSVRSTANPYPTGGASPYPTVGFGGATPQYTPQSSSTDPTPRLTIPPFIVYTPQPTPQPVTLVSPPAVQTPLAQPAAALRPTVRPPILRPAIQTPAPQPVVVTAPQPIDSLPQPPAQPIVVAAPQPSTTGTPATPTIRQRQNSPLVVETLDSTPTPSATPTPACLNARQSSTAIAKVLTPEQTKLAVAQTNQGIPPKKIIANLQLTREQKQAFREISRQQCKATIPK